MEKFESCLEAILQDDPARLIISRAVKKDAEFKKIVLQKCLRFYQAEKFTDTQVFHENLESGDLGRFIRERMPKDFLQVNAFSGQYEYSLVFTKNGAVKFAKNSSHAAFRVRETHNREKNYIFKEGECIKPLTDMGVFTKEGKVAAAMYDKYRQINRFIEAIDEIISNRPCEGLNVIDFGCGKGYLTFLLYYYLVKIKNIKAHVTGVDVKEELMLKCRKTAEEYGYDDLHFQCGDIRTFQPGILPDMIVSLHACDTATDYVLYNGIRWNVRMIFSMPCCQHELNHQIESGNFPILTRYGLLKENISSVFTDALRGNILTAYGYTVQIMDIVNPLNTPKNILIRAVKSEVDEAAKQKALEEALRLCGEFGLKPTLLSLLHL